MLSVCFFESYTVVLQALPLGQCQLQAYNQYRTIPTVEMAIEALPVEHTLSIARGQQEGCRQRPT